MSIRISISWGINSALGKRRTPGTSSLRTSVPAAHPKRLREWEELSGTGQCTAEAIKASTTWRTCTPLLFEAGYSTTGSTIRLRFTRYLLASTAILYAGRGTNTNGFADIHAVRDTGCAESQSGNQDCFRTGVSERCHNELEKWEPDARRRARPVLRERGGEIPPRHSPCMNTVFRIPTASDCLNSS